MEYGLIYLIFCVLVGFIGINRRIGFWGYTLFSVLLTPLVGLIMVIVSEPRGARRGYVVTTIHEPAASDKSYDQAAKVYVRRIENLVRSRTITREYATNYLLPLLVKDARRSARLGAYDGSANPLAVILAALEAAAPPASEPSGAPPIHSGR